MLPKHHRRAETRRSPIDRPTGRQRAQVSEWKAVRSMGAPAYRGPRIVSSPLKKRMLTEECATAWSQAVLFAAFRTALLLATQWHTAFSADR